ncbi:flagellar hook-basal body complex protein FliE [Salibacterium halotolerans]|uniref:Flagellar hook-basal body complex protein FliE n=1 Tax=Salibacterium halotolerans TaxID=1884432 RepID=A0A1I5MCI4_9BACI|nr:flagellar hook-basal body complex protein FliE [Salibacterium halotolerans]SFP07338.1 flagellar hook-basal body complex protein FliE [Salibacterium halotolerans]
MFESFIGGPVASQQTGAVKNNAGNNTTPAQAQESFKNALNDAVTKVNDAQIKSNEMTSKLASGEVENLHEVMVAAEKAGVMLQTTVEVRNKALDSYQKIMRMQV